MFGFRDRSKNDGVSISKSKPGQGSSTVMTSPKKSPKKHPGGTGGIVNSPTRRSRFRPWGSRNSAATDGFSSDIITATAVSTSIAAISIGGGILDVTNKSEELQQSAELIARTDTYDTDEDDGDVNSFETAPLTPDRPGKHFDGDQGSVHSELSMDDDPIATGNGPARTEGAPQQPQEPKEGNRGLEVEKRDEAPQSPPRTPRAVSAGQTDTEFVPPEYVIISTANCFPMEI